MIDKISLVSSVATLILFVFYFIGRIITIFSVKQIWKDKVIIGIQDESEYEIVDYVGVEEGTDNLYGVLISREGIRDLKVYEVTCSEEGLRIQKGQELFSKDFLNIDQAIGFYVETGDLFPTLIIEYKTFDYMKVRLEWRDNLKSGVFSEFIQLKHTIKSFCYYLFR